MQRHMAIGALYMILYAVIQGVVWGSIRILSEDLSFQTLFFFRNLFGVALLAPLIVWNIREIVAVRRRRLHLSRAAFSLIGGLGIFYAISVLPLPTVVAITFTAPIIASIWAMSVGGEAIVSSRILGVVGGFAGVVIAVQPTTASEPWGILAAVVAAIATAAAFVSVKALSHTEKPAILVAMPFLILLPVSAGLAIPYWTLPDLSHLWLLALMGIGFCIAQYFMAKAFASADAAAVLPFDYLRIVVTSAVGVLVLDQKVEISTLLGGTLIFASALMSLSTSEADRAAPLAGEIRNETYADSD